MTISDAPWGKFSAADYKTPADYCTATLIHLHDGPATNKEQCKLPVKEPDGNYNRNALHAAAAVLAGAHGGVDAPPAAKRGAAKKLLSLYDEAKMPPPPSLKALAG